METPMELISANEAELKINTIKSKLISVATVKIKKSLQTQAQIAEDIGISQPRISNLVNGQMHLFSVDELISICVKLECDVIIACSYEKILLA